MVENPFYLRNSREYPFYDFSLIPNGAHFSDNRYIYIQASKKNKHYYLVYDTTEESINLLTYKIPVQTTSPEETFKPLLVQLKNESSKVGLVVVNGSIYSVSNIMYVSKVTFTNKDDKKEKNISIGVHNDDSRELRYVDFKVVQDLSSSEINYTGTLPVLTFTPNT